MSNKLHLKVVTPTKVIVDIPEVSVVVAPAVEGEVGILPNHAPLFTKLQHGVITYTENNQKKYIGIDQAFMDVSDNTVTIATDNAILPEEASRERAEEAKRKAEELMQKRLEGTDFVKVEAELRKALLELKLVEHTKK